METVNQKRYQSITSFRPFILGLTCGLKRVIARVHQEEDGNENVFENVENLRRVIAIADVKQSDESSHDEINQKPENDWTFIALENQTISEHQLVELMVEG